MNFESKLSKKLCPECKTLYKYDTIYSIYTVIKTMTRIFMLGFLFVIGIVSTANIFYDFSIYMSASLTHAYIARNVQELVIFILITIIYFKLYDYWTKYIESELEAKYHRHGSVKTKDYCEKCQLFIKADQKFGLNLLMIIFSAGFVYLLLTARYDVLFTSILLIFGYFVKKSYFKSLKKLTE